MSDYKRLVSYIYSYPGSIRDKNVGFAKAEIRGGQLRLTISLKGVYTDAPQIFGIYFLVDKDQPNLGHFSLLHTGNVIVKSGMGQYTDLFNPGNINDSGYTFEDISGIAISMHDNTYYSMFSLWEDGDITTSDITFLPDGANKKSGDFVPAPPPEQVAEQLTDQVQEPVSEPVSELVSELVDEPTPLLKREQSIDYVDESDDESIVESIDEPEELPLDSDLQLKAASINSNATATVSETPTVNTASNCATEKNKTQSIIEALFSAQAQLSAAPAFSAPKKSERIKPESPFEQLFKNVDYIDAFDDDYHYNCIEVSPDQLKPMPFEDDNIINNSFLLHGYYNFKHILFGRVAENDNNTKYFIGVPGMYCNRERYMASMFGFNNFKKSHRSDFSNPYFGYWYQEI